MARRPALSVQELAWLTRDPPRDPQDQRVPWVLSDRAVDEVRWTQPVEHLDLTLEQVEFSATQWDDAVFRRCRFVAVSFTRMTFARARFEDVVFERCRFEESTLNACELLRCRFDACEFEFLTALTSKLHQCTLERLAAKVFDLRECDLSGTRFVEAKLEGLRASKVSAETLELRGGTLVGGDLTACRVRTLQSIGVAIEGLRILDSKFDRFVLSGARIHDVSLAGSEASVLAFVDCPELHGLRVLESTIGELRIETCAAVPGLLVADTEVASVILRDSVFYDAAFERVEAGPGSRMLGGGLTGVLFEGGTWASFEVSNAALAEYVALLGAHFESLRFSAMQVSDPYAMRLEGESYGPGSMTWSDARGA